MTTQTANILANFALANDLTVDEASKLGYCLARIKSVMGMTDSLVLWEMQTNPKLAELIVKAVRA